MALILRYRLEPPDSINQQVYKALITQVGTTGLNVEVPLNEDGTVAVRLTGQFISIEGEHAEPAPEREQHGSSYHQRPVDDRTPEELASGPSSREADRAAGEGG
jgi:hypothetical protein